MDDVAHPWPPADVTDADYRRASLAGTRLVAALPVTDGADRAVAVARADAPGAWSVVPVVADAADGPWRRARPGDGVAAGLVARMAAGVTAVDGFRLDVTDARLVTEVSDDERPVGVDQTNESVVVGERVAVKWLLHPDPARERAPRLLRHLAAAGFREVPPLAGTLAWRGPGMDAPMTLAIVDRWLAGAQDGWEWCTDAVVWHAAPDHHCDTRCPARFAPDLGGLVGRLHVALATPTVVIPDPVGRVGRDAIDGWAHTARTTLGEAIERTEADDAADGAELRLLAPSLAASIRALGSVAAATVQPIHADLHVGQVLRGPHGLAVIDLDGNPTADAITLQASAPAARDVASMGCSLDHVGRVAIGRGADVARVEAWIEKAWSGFLSTYRSVLADAGQGGLFDARLVGPFRVEQECRELVYAARFLPRWRYAPMGAIRAMVAGR